MKWLEWMFFASATGVTGDGATPAGAPEGGAPAGGGATPPAAAPAATPPAGGDQNVKQLREAYETLKAKHEPWERIGADPQAVSTSYGAYQKIYAQAAELGRSLGYSDEEISEALAQEPVKVLQYLQSEYAKAAGNREETEQERIERLVQEATENALSPIHEAENIRRTVEANNKFERHTMGLITDHLTKDGFKGNVAESKEADILLRITSELMKYDKAALAQLKNEGKTALIQKYFNEAVAMADQYYTTRFSRESAGAQGGGNQKTGNRPPAAGKGAAPKPTLDDMIDNPALINKRYQPGT
jgi:predicted transcriptional regulator